MLRVLFLHRDLAFHGGIPRSILYFAQAADPLRIQVRVASCLPPSPQMLEAFSQLDVTPTALGDRGYLQPLAALRQIMFQDPCDVIVAGSFKTWLLAVLATRGCATKVAFWLAGIPLVIEGRLRTWLFRRFSHNRPLIFVSEAVRRRHQPPHHRGLQKVIYYGVSDPLADPQLQPYPKEKRRELGIPQDVPLIGFTAEFVAWKDHATLLAAAARLPNVHLMLIGTGQLQDQTRQLAEQLGIAARVHFLGARPDARRLLGLIDLYVHPSRGEGLGLAVVEAMLAQKPVIAANEGAFPEYVHHQTNGLLFTPGNADELAGCIRALLENPARADNLAHRGRQDALRQFEPRRYVEQMSQALEEIAPAVNRRAHTNQAALAET